MNPWPCYLSGERILPEDTLTWGDDKKAKVLFVFSDEGVMGDCTDAQAEYFRETFKSGFMLDVPGEGSVLAREAYEDTKLISRK